MENLPSNLSILPAKDKAAIPLGTIHTELIQGHACQLREDTYFISTLFDSLVGYAIIASDFDGNIIAYNQGAHHIYGYTQEEIVGKQSIEIFFPQSDIESGRLQQITNGLMGEGRFAYKGRGLRKSGEEFPAKFLFTVTRASDGKVVGCIEIVEDLTEYERIQKTLRQSATNLHNALANNADGVVILDRNASILFLNPAAEALFGRKAEGLVGQPFGFSASVGAATELDIINTNGEMAIVEMRMTETEWGGESSYMAALRDITVRKQAEENLRQSYTKLKESQAQLIQSDKMSAVGTLAAGIAHELNNPMMGILNFSQYCLKHTSEDDRRYAVLQDIERETKRCIYIVQNLLTFARLEKDTEEAYEKVSCAALFDRVLNLLSYRIEKEGVWVTCHTDDGTPEFYVRANSVQQVFLNLMTNALDALSESEVKEIRIDIRRDGEFIQVTIADTGGGITPENLQKAFDPFFTTKPTGKGTGLGLPVSRGIIEAQGGKLTCKSEPGAGAQFRVLLPIERRRENEETNSSD